MQVKRKTIPISLKRRPKSLSKNQQRIIALVFALVIGATGQIVYSSFASTIEYSKIPAVAEMQKRTEEVIKLTDDYYKIPNKVSSKSGSKPNPTKATKKQELITKVQARKDAYRKSIQYAPQITANYYLPKTTRDKLPTEAKPYLEEQVELKGRWVAGYVHTNSHGLKGSARVQLPDGTKVRLYGSTLPDYRTGASVTIKGVRLGNTIAAATPQPITNTNPATIVDAVSEKAEAQSDDEVVFCNDPSCNRSEVEPVSDAEGGRNILVVAFRLPGQDGGIFDDGETFSIEDIDKAYNDVRNQYTVMSYGQFTPIVNVWPQYLDMKNDSDSYDLTDIDCTVDSHIDDIQDAAEETINSIPELRDKMQRVTDVALLYNNIDCSEGEPYGQGWAQLGGSAGETDIKGVSSIMLSRAPLDYVKGTYAHELGHSFGLMHAGGACLWADRDDMCSSRDSEYADPYNMMGSHDNNDSISFNAFQKNQVGWISNESIYESTTKDTETVALNALWQDNGIRAVRVNQGGRDYYIEYRPKTGRGIDNFGESKLSPGLLVYRVDDQNRTKLHNGEKGDEHESEDCTDGSDGYSPTCSTGTYHQWSYDKAATLEPLRLDEGEYSVCVTPTNVTEGSVRLIISSSCNDIKQIAPISTIGGEDAKGQRLLGVELNDPDVTQFSSANGQSCYDSGSKLLFVNDFGRVLAYDNEAIKKNSAKYVLGADTINEYNRSSISGNYSPKIFFNGFPAPAKAIDSSATWLGCGDGKLYVGLPVGNASESKIKVFDYGNGLKNGEEPVAVLGQSTFEGREDFTPPNASSLRSPNNSVYSSKHKILFVADSNNARILGFDISKGISNNMPAKYVIGQVSFTSRDDQPIGKIRPSYITLDTKRNEIYVAGGVKVGLGTNEFNSNKIQKYSVQDIVDGERKPLAVFDTPGGEGVRGVLYDSKDDRVIVLKTRSLYIYDAEFRDDEAPEQLASYSVDSSQYAELAYATYDPEGRRLFSTGSRYGFGANHRNIFSIPPRDPARLYQQLGY